MKKRNGIVISFFFSIILLAAVYDTFVIYGGENETLTRQYTFTSNSETDKGKGFQSEITENGKKYRLEDAVYKVVNKKALTEKKKKSITMQSGELAENTEYTPKKKIVRDNVTYKLKNTKKEEKTIRNGGRREVTGYLDFDSKNAAENAPDTRTFTANGATAECKKQSMEKLEASGWEDSYINITFMSQDKNYYEWNGVQVDGDAKNPLKGHEKEILKSIGADTGNYTVVTTYWNGRAYRKDGMYYRKARADIRKKIPHYRVHYKGYSRPEEKRMSVYISTYEAAVKEKTGEYEYTIEAAAVYREIVPETTVQPEMPKIIRSGIILLSVGITGVLFIIYFKSGKERKAK